MFSQVTVTAVAALLAVVSALFALVFLRYGIPRAARNGPNRNGQETVGISVLLCGGNVVLVVAFLLNVVQFVYYGVDSQLFSRLFFGLFLTPVLTPVLTPSPSCCYNDRVGVDPSAIAVGTMLTTLLVAMIWYTLSLAVLAIEMSAGRSRRQR